MNRYSTILPASSFPAAAHGGIVTAQDLRRSISRPTQIITANQIPAGAQVIRIQNPAQYNTRQPIVQQAVTYPVHYYEPGCCEQISPCCTPDDAIHGVRNAGNTLVRGAGNLANGAYEGVGNLATGAGNLASNAYHGAGNLASGAYHGVKNACPWWLWAIISVIGLILLAGVVWGLLTSCGGFWNSAWQGTKNAASTAWQGAQNLGRSAGDAAKGAAEGIASGAKSVVDTTGNLASGAWDAAKGVGKSVGEVAGSAAEGVASGVKSVAQTTGNVASSAWDVTKAAGNHVVQGGKVVGQHVGKALSHENYEYAGHFRNLHYRRMY